MQQKATRMYSARFPYQNEQFYSKTLSIVEAPPAETLSLTILRNSQHPRGVCICKTLACKGKMIFPSQPRLAPCCVDSMFRKCAVWANCYRVVLHEFVVIETKRERGRFFLTLGRNYLLLSAAVPNSSPANVNALVCESLSIFVAVSASRYPTVCGANFCTEQYPVLCANVRRQACTVRVVVMVAVVVVVALVVAAVAFFECVK